MIRRLRDALRRLLLILPGSTRWGVPVLARPPRPAGVRIRWDRRLWFIFPLLLLLAVATLGWRSVGGPPSLDEAALVGPRHTQGPVCLAVAGDTSGSMARLAGVRRDALRSLVQFARRSLKGDDLIEAVVFADGTAVALPPTRVADLHQDDLPEPAVPTRDTRLVPAVDRVGRLFPVGGCSQRALVVVTDGMVSDDVADLARTLAAARLAAVAVLIPGGHGRPPAFRSPELAGVTVAHFDADNADQLGLRYGDSLATLTGQRLGKRG